MQQRCTSWTKKWIEIWFTFLFSSAMMELSTPSPALPKSRTLLCLPSWRSPSLKVKKPKSLQMYFKSLCRVRMGRCWGRGVSPPLQTLPPALTGCCPPTTRVTLWSTAAPTTACSASRCPGSWAGSPPCPRRPWRSCAASCPPTASMWTRWSPPTRTRPSAAPCTSKQRSSCFSLQDCETCVSAINLLYKSNLWLCFYYSHSMAHLFCSTKTKWHHNINN